MVCNSFVFNVIEVEIYKHIMNRNYKACKTKAVFQRKLEEIWC